MRRAYYSKSKNGFHKESNSSILGQLVAHHGFSTLDDLQRNSWIEIIKLLKNQLSTITDYHILFEYSIPRMGKRVDVVLLMEGIVYVLEFKIGSDHYSKDAIDQVVDYSLDLKNFHEQSHTKQIVPIIIATDAPEKDNTLQSFDDLVYAPLRANRNNLRDVIQLTHPLFGDEAIDAREWEESIYKPTPTIIEAAKALYTGHTVDEIARSDSKRINLGRTSDSVEAIIDEARKMGRKSICFVTGVPGSGKTLAGLNIANKLQNSDENKHTVFLSGNRPLVEVLQEALAQNAVKEQTEISKPEALSSTRAFIQQILHYRDDALQSDRAPADRIAIFDEAQRAWNQRKLSSWLSRKRAIHNFQMSEPEFLVSVLDRHEDWATIVCLVGGGQEIHSGEAGIFEWFKALNERFSDWHVYVSNNLTDQEYVDDEYILSMIREGNLHVEEDLHLSVSIRSFRSEKVSQFVKEILDCNHNMARMLYYKIIKKYPVFLTRSIEDAKNWLRSKARGSERFGLVASSGAKRLKPTGINVDSKITPKHWFLNGKDDVRSSYFLEEVATEFDIQGLELDWICVAWDADLRFAGKKWKYKNFSGTVWHDVHNKERRKYLLNTYRVLLTRARQGMIIFVPKGNDDDETRKKIFYNGIYDYLLECGIESLEHIE